MTPRERDLLAQRYAELEAEIAAIQAGRVVDGDPYEVESRFLAEQSETQNRLVAERDDAR